MGQKDIVNSIMGERKLVNYGKSSVQGFKTNSFSKCTWKSVNKGQKLNFWMPMEAGSHPESNRNKNGEKQPSQSRDIMIEDDAAQVWQKMGFGTNTSFWDCKNIKTIK